MGSGKTITGLTINAGQTTGHYFTVNSAYTNGDGNDTIAYSGTGSNIQESTGTPLDSFTATTVTNNVAAPAGTVVFDTDLPGDNIATSVNWGGGSPTFSSGVMTVNNLAGSTSVGAGINPGFSIPTDGSKTYDVALTVTGGNSASGDIDTIRYNNNASFQTEESGLGVRTNLELRLTSPCTFY